MYIAIIHAITGKHAIPFPRHRTHRCYTQQTHPGWTWEPIQRQHFRPFDSIAEQLILSVCIAGMLAIILHL